MRLEVDCYAGYKGEERPVRFRRDGVEFVVEKVLEQYYGPDEVSFRVLASDGKTYLLRRDLSSPEGCWRLDVAR